MKNPWEDEKLIEVLKRGGVAVIPTDTIYGIVGSASNPNTVERIYKIKKRTPEKPLITLIGNWSETKKFGIDTSKYKIPESSEPTTYIIEGVSFRVPGVLPFRNFLSETGPLVAPSANPEGMPPARNMNEAREYFGEAVDYYAGDRPSAESASRVIKLHKDGSVSILRG